MTMALAGMAAAMQHVGVGLYAVVVAGSVLSVLAPQLAPALTYGKSHAAQHAQREGGGWLRGLARHLGSWTVPKWLFVVYYLLASAHGVGALAVAVYASRRLSGTDSALGAAAQLPLAVFALHAWRRLAECLWVHRFSATARMPVVIWAAGVAFYLVAPWALMPAGDLMARGCATAALPRWAEALLVASGVTLSVVGQGLQHATHVALAALKRDGDGSYPLPLGGVFNLSWAPHYTGEIIVYAGFVVLTAATSPVSWLRLWLAGHVADDDPCLWRSTAALQPLLLFAFVVFNLTATGRLNRETYAQAAAEGKQAHGWSPTAIRRHPAVLPGLC